ncbi:DUF1294 domain-containing protein [Hoylesella loescheii]|uniref:Cold-shock DNA-binding domain protein n=1 Tax=Hoylesella loescheii DSM 19665 = JCM 12249 = ATCC 15930 TaxID=1122985 RepID=A0A069QHX2_HOYLO|nr:DUF1294 domain-containing protein [Hoylesella loescheii]KDR52390.1 hypothetical protein HMPREF1991_01573 [Hoylesella loescheii DSM 19665 = JCM 12249 = ATCC 15930]
MKGLPLHVVLAYFITVNVLGLVLFGIDKWKAKHDKWRISEATLLSVTVIGGSIGAWVGMKVWHHKTMQKKFKYGIPLVMVLQFSLLLFTLYWLNSI